MLKLVDINGSPYIGVFCRTTENVIVLPTFMEPDIVKDFSSALEVEPVRVTIGGSPITGSLLAANSHGAVVADIVTGEELAVLKESFNSILILEDRHNAAGNIILCNDSRGFIHPGVSRNTVEDIENTLRIELRRSRIAGIDNVGSVAVATNRGVLCHPKTSPNELEDIKDYFSLDVEIGTVNYGTSFIGSGVVANSKGALIGNATTGIETNRVEWALGYLG